MAILNGMHNQMLADGVLNVGVVGPVPAEEEQRTFTPQSTEGFSGRYKDDLTGQTLRDDLVHEARAKELAFFTTKGAWLKRPIGEARSTTGRAPISVRWVDVNKGDDLCPNYRSRLVARQIKAWDKSGQSFFAPAPPLESLRFILSISNSACERSCASLATCRLPRVTRQPQALGEEGRWVAFAKVSRNLDAD